MIQQTFQFNSLADLCRHLRISVGKKQVFLLTDENVSEYWLTAILAGSDAYGRFEVIEAEAGEESKSADIALHIISQLIATGAGRDAVIINLGGGMICDLGGFVASIYKRGIEHINIPTTLLAMVDAAVGGKTAINHDQIKNVIGTFHLPKEVLLCADFLATLPQEELNSGYGEMIKHGVISGKKLLQKISKLEPNSVPDIALISACAEVKYKIVAEDPTETGKRKILNLGHTFGHAYESALMQQEQAVMHGHCVAEGMVTEIVLAAQKSLIGVEEAEELIAVIRKFFPKGRMSLPHFEEVQPFLMHDKKNENGKLKMSLPVSTGKVKYNIEATQSEAKKAHNRAIKMY